MKQIKIATTRPEQDSNGAWCAGGVFRRGWPGFLGATPPCDPPIMHPRVRVAVGHVSGGNYAPTRPNPRVRGWLVVVARVTAGFLTTATTRALREPRARSVAKGILFQSGFRIYSPVAFTGAFRGGGISGVLGGVDSPCFSQTPLDPKGSGSACPRAPCRAPFGILVSQK